MALCGQPILHKNNAARALERPYLHGGRGLKEKSRTADKTLGGMFYTTLKEGHSLWLNEK